VLHCGDGDDNAAGEEQGYAADAIDAINPEMYE
jgi:hypothetical protein